MRRLVAISMLTLATAAHARDGGQAIASRGTVAIAASVAAAVRTAAPETLDPRGDAALCLWTNTATGLVRVAADGVPAAAVRPGCSAIAMHPADARGTLLLVSPE